MNTDEGRKIRFGCGAHVTSSDDTLRGSCMLCGSRTQRFCMTCSVAYHDVKFYICETKSCNVTPQRPNKSSCFQLMHKNAELVEVLRKKCTTENQLHSLSKMNATNATNHAKRIRIGDGATQSQKIGSDNGATEPQEIGSDNEDATDEGI